MYVSVVVNIPLEKRFSYYVPPFLRKEVCVGKRVWVPFGKRRIVGYIVAVSDKSELENIKPIESIIDAEPILSEDLLSLTKWVSDYYICSWSEAIEAAIPGPLKKGKLGIKSKKPLRLKRIKRRTLPLTPTPEQRYALEMIKKSIDKSQFSVFLLHGITGSGKTEVYMQSISYVLEKGKSSIVLVPEISLTPQTVERFKLRFGDNVAVMHSGLTGSMRFYEYRRIRDKDAQIVVGARSAIFSPVKNLGLVIVDEEHETSYKQENTPRYHAREVAIKRAEITGAVVILGSATPSLESYYNAKQGQYKLIELTKRMKDIDLPKVNIVDMRKELYSRHYVTIFSHPLREAIEHTLSRKKQVILFLNRRGFATFVSCRNCGAVLKCKKCDATLVYHYLEKKLICHYCNWSMSPPKICSKCRSSYVRYYGIGTEKVESELHRYFPEGMMDRMDTDTTKKRGSHDRILNRFKKHNINILVGTQMIAKGLDFPKVTLVGIISADTTLNIPDFRASERTFNLLTQVAGRAGRSKEGGRVIIQTYIPDHYAITAASRHDYKLFYKREIRFRKELELPPFVNLMRFIVSSKKEQVAKDTADELVRKIRKRIRRIKILGPAPTVVYRLRNRYRWNFVLKTKTPTTTAIYIKDILNNIRLPGGVSVNVDVDPISM